MLGLRTHEIKTEKSRTYVYPDGWEYVITNPVKLATSESGNHRVTDANNKLHIVLAGFRVILIDGELEF